MSKITRITRNDVRALRADIDAALAKVLEKHGLTHELGRITFSDSDFRGQLRVAVGSADDAAEREFRKYAYKFGLTGNEFGKTFTNGKTKFTITGLKPRSHTYPILATNARGTTYKFPADFAKRAV